MSKGWGTSFLLLINNPEHLNQEGIGKKCFLGKCAGVQCTQALALTFQKNIQAF